ncbi:hypothetical protein [Pseudomonas mandelii]|uniref:hypothetical protein n=1 Tax=Pseudomonas mandelii TaxID=75612 RepID=UPI00224A62B9|nr:hypothetical protein [Pseudomonas mandelii]MCX2896682.1 hypothetical protein [Pseudomonas mandelii]
MHDNEMSDSETDSSDEDLLSLFNATSIGMLYNFAYHFASEESREILDALTGKAKVEFINFLDRSRLEIALSQQIERWREHKASKLTGVIIKIINNTPHTFNISQTSLPLSKSERESFQINPHEPTAFFTRYEYTFAYPWKKRDMFNHFVDFIDGDVGVRFELGLFMGITYGILSPTHTPKIKNKTASTGRSSVKCKSAVTRVSDDAPFNFEIQLTLG